MAPDGMQEMAPRSRRCQHGARSLQVQATLSMLGAGSFRSARRCKVKPVRSKTTRPQATAVIRSVGINGSLRLEQPQRAVVVSGSGWRPAASAWGDGGKRRRDCQRLNPTVAAASLDFDAGVHKDRYAVVLADPPLILEAWDVNRQGVGQRRFGP